MLKAYVPNAVARRRPTTQKQWPFGCSTATGRFEAPESTPGLGSQRLLHSGKLLLPGSLEARGLRVEAWLHARSSDTGSEFS